MGEPVDQRHTSRMVEQINVADRKLVFRSILPIARINGSKAKYRQ